MKRHKHEHCRNNDCWYDHDSACNHDHGSDTKKTKNLKILVIPGISLLALIAGYIDPLGPYGTAANLLNFSWIAIILCGAPIYISAVKALLKGKITSSLLVSIAITASVTMGILTVFGAISDGHENYFFAASEIAFLMALGELIEDLTTGKARSALKDLIAMKPETAFLKTDDGYRETDIKQIKKGDILLIKPNGIISADGVVVTGKGYVNEANITGESAPAEKGIGDTLYAGTVNLDSAFLLEVTKPSDETVLSKLIEYVKNAENNRAPVVRLADKWASYLVPAACLISVLVFLAALFIFKTGALEAAERAITILVVVCPCALALATPVAVSAAIGNAGKKGILIKSGAALEALTAVDTVAFDKTGTLTEGNLRVDKVFSRRMEEKELIYYAAAAELNSEHPIAKAVIAYANGYYGTPENTESEVGTGVSSTVNGKKVRVVKYALLEEKIKEGGWYEDGEHQNTVLAVEIDGEPEGVITVSDTVRAGAKETIDELKDKGYGAVMLTGDNEKSAGAAAKAIGIDYFSGLLPEDKVSYIAGLKGKNKKVLMVGDGVNDAPALSVSDSSLAMGAKGNSIAIETADISLLNSDLKNIPYVLKLAKRALTTIRINITLAMTINVAAVILSLLGLLNVVAGAFLHNIGSVLVSFNAMLLLFYKRKAR